MKTIVTFRYVLKWEQFFLPGKMKHQAKQKIGDFVVFDFSECVI